MQCVPLICFFFRACVRGAQEYILGKGKWKYFRLIYSVLGFRLKAWSQIQISLTWNIPSCLCLKSLSIWHSVVWILWNNFSTPNVLSHGHHLQNSLKVCESFMWTETLPAQVKYSCWCWSCTGVWLCSYPLSSGKLRHLSFDELTPDAWESFHWSDMSAFRALYCLFPQSPWS